MGRNCSWQGIPDLKAADNSVVLECDELEGQSPGWVSSQREAYIICNVFPTCKSSINTL